LDSFYHNRVKIFRILHLLYQEMKLNKLHQNRLRDMSYFLFCFAKYLNHDLGAVYCDYYLRENIGNLERFKSDFSLKQMDEMIQVRQALNVSPSKQRDSKTGQIFTNEQSAILEKEPPDILKWIQNKLNQYNRTSSKSTNLEANSSLVMPVAFKMTHQICKIFEILTEKHSKDYETVSPLQQRVLSSKENLLENK
jgi:hypothetical protein